MLLSSSSSNHSSGGSPAVLSYPNGHIMGMNRIGFAISQTAEVTNQRALARISLSRDGCSRFLMSYVLRVERHGTPHCGRLSVPLTLPASCPLAIVTRSCGGSAMPLMASDGGTWRQRPRHMAACPIWQPSTRPLSCRLQEYFHNSCTVAHVVGCAFDCTSQAAHVASAGNYGALRVLRRHTRGVAWCRRVFQLASGFRKHTSVDCHAMHMPLLQSCVIHTWSNILCMPPHASVWYLGALAWLQPQPRHSIARPIPACTYRPCARLHQ